VSRLSDVVRFYEILSFLERRHGGKKMLAECAARMSWPKRGVYFIFEPGELRTDSGDGLRVVRVGTHAVSKGSRSTLWCRLSQHRGTKAGAGGNHRGSVFRLLVGAALAARDQHLWVPTWGKGQSAPKDIRATEEHLEREVSRYIGTMPLLWVGADDSPSAESVRAYIERNAIALLSNAMPTHSGVVDPCSSAWLGRCCPSDNVRRSGLWNSRSVAERYAPEFLDVLQGLPSS
jgi:hypothetical protein